MLKIHSIETFGTHEGPGIRTVTFVQGCNFKCLYCHNPDTIECNSGKDIENDYIIDLVEKNRPYYGNNGGITISGGECLLQARNLISLFKELKNKGIHITIDTNGSLLTDNVKELLEYTDLVLLDIKHINNEGHKNLTGLGNEQVFKFADYLKEKNKNTWLRYVYVPGINDNEEYLEKIGNKFATYENIERMEILPYHNLGIHKWEILGWDYKLKDVPLPSKIVLERARKIFVKYFGEKRVFVRN